MADDRGAVRVRRRLAAGHPIADAAGPLGDPAVVELLEGPGRPRVVGRRGDDGAEEPALAWIGQRASHEASAAETGRTVAEIALLDPPSAG